MPLVTFSRIANTGAIASSNLTPALNAFRHVINLPRQLHNKHWKLKSVNVQTRTNTDGTIRYRMNHVDIRFPQLMDEESTRFFIKNESSNPQAPQPPRALRFFCNYRSMDYRFCDCHTSTVTIQPELNFGSKRLDDLFLVMEISVRDVNMDYIGVTGYEIILEYT